jgi:hypothetical protein
MDFTSDGRRFFWHESRSAGHTDFTALKAWSMGNTADSRQVKEEKQSYC